MTLRTPIVCVLGHVDHGKTTLLDRIRGSTIVDMESGAITQHIGATEVPIDAIAKACGPIFSGKFIVPGLLFIDTPGHHAFTTLRSRGGALADLAVLIVDINEGFLPQTIESLNILKRFKTPFVVVANKIDRIHGWQTHEGMPFIQGYEKQVAHVQQKLDHKLYELIGKLYEYGFSADRYDRISDFKTTISVIPICAKTGEGVPDLLMVMLGLAQRFLEGDLQVSITDAGVCTVLEVDETRGFGTTVDAILYDGELSVGDTIVVGGHPVVTTKVRALLKPKPMTEIWSNEAFDHVKHLTAAAGIKIAAPNLEHAIAGSTIKVASGDVDAIVSEIESELDAAQIKTDSDGVVVCADTIGSLEAVTYELTNAGIQIRVAKIGDISRRDVIGAETSKDPMNRTIIGFRVDTLPDAIDELKKSGTRLFQSEVIYRLLEDYQDWKSTEKELVEKKLSEAVIRPGQFKLLDGCVFRQNNPAVVGVRVIGGVVRTGVGVMRADGAQIGTIKGIQEHGDAQREARCRDEVAVAIEGPTVGRQIKEGDTLFVDIPEQHAKMVEQELSNILSPDETETFSEFMEIKRKGDPFWGK
ncbi:MAG: putative translation initiation factor IF-2 [Candidatus Methanogaster sp.]|nr:MAG: putative translation initiation factor IF-2 [ANME-2 cluster archaeon]